MISRFFFVILLLSVFTSLSYAQFAPTQTIKCYPFSDYIIQPPVGLSDATQVINFAGFENRNLRYTGWYQTDMVIDQNGMKACDELDLATIKRFQKKLDELNISMGNDFQTIKRYGRVFYGLECDRDRHIQGISPKCSIDILRVNGRFQFADKHMTTLVGRTSSQQCSDQLKSLLNQAHVISGHCKDVGGLRSKHELHVKVIIPE